MNTFDEDNILELIKTMLDIDAKILDSISTTGVRGVLFVIHDKVYHLMWNNKNKKITLKYGHTSKGQKVILGRSALFLALEEIRNNWINSPKVIKILKSCFKSKFKANNLIEKKGSLYIFVETQRDYSIRIAWLDKQNTTNTIITCRISGPGTGRKYVDLHSYEDLIGCIGAFMHLCKSY